MRLLASTDGLYNSIEQSWEQENEALGGVPCLGYSLQGPNLFKRCEWTADGTSLLTASSDYGMRLFIVPPELLEDGVSPLTPYTRRFMPSPIVSQALYPEFNLNETSTCIAAVSHKQAPIKLYDVLAQDESSPCLVSFELMHNEEYVVANDMQFLENRSRLVCGSKGIVASFDYSAKRPVETTRQKGTVCTVRTNSANEVAVGTFEGIVGVYDHNSELALVHERKLDSRVLDIVWDTANDHYLYIATKKGIATLDRRTGLSEVSFYEERLGSRARVAHGHNGDELWCGSADGRLIKLKHNNSDISQRTVQTMVNVEADQGSVSSVAMHPTVNICATTVDSNTDANASALHIWH